MGAVKKLFLIIVAIATFVCAAYNFVWSPGWQSAKWPESRLRALYISIMAEAAINHGVDYSDKLNAVLSADPNVEEKIMKGVLASLLLTIFSTTSIALLPGAFTSEKEGRIRGAKLVSALQLKRELWLRRNRLRMLLLSCYAIVGAAAGWAMFHSLYAASYCLAAALLVFAVIDQVAKQGSDKAITVGNVQIPKQAEGRHFLIAGTTGAGKSLLIYQMIADARARGDRGFVLDIGSACSRRFRRTVDLILEPGKKGSVRWNPFLEIQSRLDFLELARATIPDASGENQGFHDMARVLLSAVMQKMYDDGDFSVSRLLYLVCSSKKEELNAIVVNTPADIYTQDGGERLLQSVRSVLSTSLVAWQVLEDGGDFSVRKWIRSAPPGQWLFCRYSDAQATLMRQLLSTWLSLAIKETISDDERIPPPTWFIADEFDSLGAISASRDALTKLRRYGGRCVFGVQTVAQLWATYGRDIAIVLLSCLSSQFFLRAGDPETAEYCSKSLGEQELMREEHSRSRRGLLGLGGDPSNTEASRHVTERVVLPSELQTLPDLYGYLKIAGDLPAARIRVPIPATEVKRV